MQDRQMESAEIFLAVSMSVIQKGPTKRDSYQTSRDHHSTFPGLDRQWPAAANIPDTSMEQSTERRADPSLRITVASNPGTPARLLAQLARDQDMRVVQAVACNPNTPWHILEHLAWAFPTEFLSNPVGPCQMLAYPEQICTDERFHDALLREASIPPLWWSWLKSLSRWRSRPAIYLHIQSAGETRYFAGDPQEEEETILLTLIQLLAEASAQKAPLPLCRLPNRPAITCEQITKERLHWLARSGNHKIRKAVARHPQTPEEILHTLAQDRIDWVREAVASHPQTPDAILHILAQDHAERVRRAVAAHPRTPGSVLQTLAQDRDEWIRRTVAIHPHIPAEVVYTLAQDPIAWVREAAARHPQVPAEILHILAQDRSAGVRKAAASNPFIPVALLCILAQDADEWVRQAVARHPQVPVDILRALAQDNAGGVRQAVAGHLRTPKDTLRDLAQDCSERVWRAATRNPQALMERLPILAQAGDPTIQRRANLALNLLAEVEELIGKKPEEEWLEKLSILLWDVVDDNLAVASIEKQLNTITNLDVPEHVCQRIIATLAADWDATLIRGAFLRTTERKTIMAPFMPPSALQKFATSPSWEVRYLVALHPQTPWETRQRLSLDGNRYVRAVARANREECPSVSGTCSCGQGFLLSCICFDHLV